VVWIKFDIEDRKRAEEQPLGSTQELQRSERYLTEQPGSWAFDPAGFD
jgi:hypothetical protein